MERAGQSRGERLKEQDLEKQRKYTQTHDGPASSISAAATCWRMCRQAFACWNSVFSVFSGFAKDYSVHIDFFGFSTETD